MTATVVTTSAALSKKKMLIISSIFRKPSKLLNRENRASSTASEEELIWVLFDSAPKKPFLVDLLGAPANWEGQDLTELLVSQGWSEIQIVTRKKVGYRNFKWILKGLPPEDPTDPDKNTWQYLDTEGSLHFYVEKRSPEVLKCKNVFLFNHQGKIPHEFFAQTH